MSLTIAVDGPSGSGKSTAAKIVSHRLDLKYIDTGAMYRAVTLGWINSDCDSINEERIASLAADIEMEFGRIKRDGSQNIYLNDKDISSRIRRQDIDRYVSDIASISEVREIMLEKQRRFAREKGIIMDGRDIGSRVLPDADLKIYLTASLDVRARRRYRELKERGEDISLAEVKKELKKRDKKDRSRSHSPLVRADSAITINSDHLSAEEVAEKIIELAESEMKE